MKFSYRNIFMRYQTLLFSGLLIGAVTFPLTVQADTLADRIKSINDATERRVEIQDRERTQEDTKLIIEEYKTTSQIYITKSLYR
jgi:hypothetical protein